MDDETLEERLAKAIKAVNHFKSGHGILQAEVQAKKTKSRWAGGEKKESRR